MSKCGRFFNRHKWYKFWTKGPEPPKGYAQSYKTYRVCRKCGSLQEHVMGWEVEDYGQWENRGTLPDFKTVIDYHESEKQKRVDKQTAIETAVHKATDLISVNTHEKRSD